MIQQRVRKLAYLFKHLQHIANKDTLKMVCQALVKSILNIAFKSWSEAAKTQLLEVERSQRMLIKVNQHKPKLFQTAKVYVEVPTNMSRKRNSFVT